MSRKKPLADRFKRSSDSPGQIVQFRVDDLLITQLTVIAERLRTPVGVLARQWVAERLRKEIEQDKQSIESWRQQRLTDIDQKLRVDMEKGPAQILHLLPLASDVTINPEDVRKLSSLLAPVERVEMRYTGRINVHGFVTEKVFRDSSKLNGYVQLFRSGQLESVRILREDDTHKALYGDQIDYDLIRAAWSYCTALQQLSVPLPLVLVTSLKDVKGYTLRTRNYAERTCLIDVNNFNLPTIQITDWSQIARIENLAQMLRTALDVLWNAGGFERSPSYKDNGTWRGPLDPW